MKVSQRSVLETSSLWLGHERRPRYGALKVIGDTRVPAVLHAAGGDDMAGGGQKAIDVGRESSCIVDAGD